MCPHNKRIYSLYLSTLISSGAYKCDKTNLASCKWNIDWATIFPADTNGKDCIVRIKLISEEVVATTLTYDANLGTVRANFSSVYQNSLNGVILGLLVPQDGPASNTTNHVLSADTMTNANGVRIKVPNGNSFFNIFLMDLSEALLTSANLNDYQIEFNFEIIE
jgi:hypothetical protein